MGKAHSESIFDFICCDSIVSGQSCIARSCSCYLQPNALKHKVSEGAIERWARHRLDDGVVPNLFTVQQFLVICHQTGRIIDVTLRLAQFLETNLYLHLPKQIS